VGVRYARPDAALLEVPEPDPVEDTPLCFPLPYCFPSPIADTAAGRSSRTATANTPYDRMMSPNTARSIFILRPLLKVSVASAGFAWGSYTSQDIRRSPALTFTKKPKARTVLCTLDTPRCP
jgi:hypothetical protein